MPFQVTLSAKSLKVFSKCLACLARYGDNVVFQADLNALTVSSVNTCKSAFGRIKFNAPFFEKYHVRASQPPGSTFRTPPSLHDQTLGQLSVKSLLSIFKHKTIDKTMERCRLSIQEPGHENGDDSDEEKDSLELRLVVRLYCTHGIVKTHKLVLLTPTNVPSPRIPSMPTPPESRVVIGPRALKDVLEHVSYSKGPKHDPQLLWMFGLNDVKVKTHHSVADTKGGKGQQPLSTEISIDADEFELYQINDPPSEVGFHLKEFNATIALAEALSVVLIIRFTEPTEPVVIEFDSDIADYEFLFIVSTTNNNYGQTMSNHNNLRKRHRVAEPTASVEHNADGNVDSTRTYKKRSEHAGNSRASEEGSSALESSNVYKAISFSETTTGEALGNPETRPLFKDTALFLPGASQLSTTEPAFPHGTSRVEHLAYEDFEAMMNAGSQVGMSTRIGMTPMKQYDLSGGDVDEDSRMEDDNEMFPATQRDSYSHHKSFQPLFDD